jgi:hypothetical protein
MTSIHSAADGSRALIAEKKAVREDRRHEWSRLHRIGAGQTSLGHTDHEVLVVDKLTYAGNLASLASVQGHPRYHFIRSDICDRAAIADIFSSFDPDAVMRTAPGGSRCCPLASGGASPTGVRDIERHRLPPFVPSSSSKNAVRCGERPSRATLAAPGNIPVIFLTRARTGLRLLKPSASSRRWQFKGITWKPKPRPRAAEVSPSG